MDSDNPNNMERTGNEKNDEIYDHPDDLKRSETEVDNKDNLSPNNCMVCGLKNIQGDGLNTNKYYICKVCISMSEVTRDGEISAKDIPNENKLDCRLCEKTFSRRSSLIRHYRLHAGRKYSCPHCPKLYNQIGCLNRHIADHFGIKETLMCEICEKTFGRRSSLYRHLRLHTGDIKPEFNCDVCNKLFKTKAHLKRHCLSHTGEKPFVCDVCEKGFITSSKLKEHYRLHTGDGFTCPECQKEFSSSTKLRIHLVTHSDVKPFFCTECGKSYAKKCSLDNHIATVHNKMKYTCEICDKGFKTQEYLSQHYSLHSGDKTPLYCTKCSMTFNSENLFKEHKATHKKARLHECEKCGKRFRRKQHLRRHDNFHEKPYSCRFCSDSFSQKHILEKHIKKHIETGIVTNDDSINTGNVKDGKLDDCIITGDTADVDMADFNNTSNITNRLNPLEVVQCVLLDDS